jgi:putative endonuclease
MARPRSSPVKYCPNNTCLSKHIALFACARKPEFALPAMPPARHIWSMPSFVYVLKTENPSGRTITYVGWTLDLERRLEEHNGGKRGAKTTRGRVWLLVYAEKHRTRKGAMRREYVLKRDRKFRAGLKT